MCDVCHRSPCNPRCPNAPDPPAVYTCAHCGEPIVPGEEYVEFDGKYYHFDDCIQDVALTLLLEKAGAYKGVAESPDRPGWGR